jgi:hypothetical protein
MIHHRGTEDTEVLARSCTHDIVGAAEVHRRLGPGLLESAYQMCLCRELLIRGIGFQSQVPLPVQYRGLLLDCGYRLDIVVNDSPPWPIDQLQCGGTPKRALPHHQWLT